MPLLVPKRPWSHVAVDFATDLPESKGYTVILVVILALFRSVFLHYGFPEDILSDWGPQFMSRVWDTFFKKLKGSKVKQTDDGGRQRCSGLMIRSGSPPGTSGCKCHEKALSEIHGALQKPQAN